MLADNLFGASPSGQDVIVGHEELKQASHSIEGTFKVFRLDEPIETNNLAKLDEADLPLLSEGELWRMGSNFRLKFRRYSQSDQHNAPELISLASTEFAAYEYISSSDGSPAMLRISGPNTSEYKTVRDIASNVVLSRIDILWNYGNISISSLLQRPDAQLQLTPDYVKIDVQLEPQARSVYHLDKTLHYALIEASNTTIVDETVMSMMVKIVNNGNNSQLLPTRIIETFSGIEGLGYCELAVLELGALADPNQLQNLSADSFRDMGETFQTYEIHENETETLGDRILVNSRPISTGMAGSYFWLALSMFSLGLICIFWIMRRKRSPNAIRPQPDSNCTASRNC